MRRALPLFALVFAPLAFAQPLPVVARMAAALDKHVAARDISGAVAATGTAAGPPAVVAVGKADIAAGTPMTPAAAFRIASMTKPITALAIMMLSDDGKLAVDDPLSKFLPECGDWKVTPRGPDGKPTGPPVPAARPVLLRDLMTHTSGIPGGMPAEFKDLYLKRDRTLAEVAPALVKRPLEFQPGEKWAYCNAGIDLLGRVVEVASGKSFETFLQTRLFDPLEMCDTAFYPPPGLSGRVAKTYGEKDGRLVETPFTLIGPGDHAKYPIPAGGLVSTAEDLGKLYAMMLRRGQVAGGRRLVSESSVAAMTRVQTGEIKTGFVDGMGFGFGWGVVREPKGVTATLSPGSYGHGGAFGTQGWIDPAKGRYTILLIQRTGLKNGDASAMRQSLLDAVAASD